MLEFAAAVLLLTSLGAPPAIAVAGATAGRLALSIAGLRLSEPTVVVEVPVHLQSQAVVSSDKDLAA